MLVVWVWLLLVTSGWGQRVIFPTQVAQGGSFYSTYPQDAGAIGNAPLYSTPYNPTAPGTYLPPAGTFTPNVSPWDPYADPGSLAAPNLTQPPMYQYPASPYGDPNVYGSPWTTIEGYYQRTVRLIQNFRAQETWLAGDGGANDFDVNVLDLGVTFGIPAGQIQQPILITPRFAFNWWAGPQSDPFMVAPRDLPAVVYDSVLETAWRPQFTPRFGADLMVGVGMYGDYRFTDSHTFRVTGRGLGLFSLTPNAVFAVGVWYINRDRVKLLPAGGIIWTPNPDTKYEILFPNPKLAQRIATVRNSNLWGYIAGEYGGGQWTVQHNNGLHDVVNYNDMRAIVGIESISNHRLRSNLEVGYVFNREILYRDGTPVVNPGDTVMLRFGLQY